MPLVHHFASCLLHGSERSGDLTCWFLYFFGGPSGLVCLLDDLKGAAVVSSVAADAATFFVMAWFLMVCVALKRARW